MGKSLDDIWRQMQAQRAAEQQAKAAQERALYEQRERARQEYLQRMRMYEFTSFNPAAAAAASSAAGAGGGQVQQQQVVVSTSNQATLHWSFDSDNNILYYFAYNFGTGELSDINQIALYDSPNNYPVTEGGFFLYANNNNDSTIDMLYIDSIGQLIWQESTDNQIDYDFENFSRYVAAYYLKDGNWKLVLFDADSNIKTFNFGENLIEGGGYSYNNVWSGGIVVVEEIGTIRRYWIINVAEETKTQFYEVDNDEGYFLSVYQYAYSDKILTVKNGDLWEVFSSGGEKLSEFNTLTEFSTLNWVDSDFTFLDDNGSFLIFGYDNDNDYRTITLFSGSTFSSKVIDNSVYSSYNFDIFNQKDYDSTSNWNAEGSAIFIFYDGSNEPDNVRYYTPEGLILPIWSTDGELRDFYTFSNTRGINENLNDSNISFIRSADHICLLVDNDPGDENYSILRFNREGLEVTVIETDVNKSRDLYDDDQINGKTILQFERGLTNSGSWGWSDLSDVESRFYYSLRFANNNQIGNLIVDQELIMKDVENDDYWAIKFSEWEDGGGGGFAYTRQLIIGGTYSGDLIYFTFSSFLQEESDIISEGVLELRRGYNGPIYNVAKEGESNSYNPTGTLWNSEWVYEPITEYDHYIVGDGQIIGSVSTGTNYNDVYQGKTYILEDRVFNKLWVSNTENSQNWTLLDKYYEEFDDVNNTVTEDGIRKGIFAAQNGFDYRIITEDAQAEFSVPFTGSYSNKIEVDNVFHKGAFVLSEDETQEWIRFYDINGNLIDTIEKLGSFDSFSDWVYGDRCVVAWDEEDTRRFAFFNGESVQQLNSGRQSWNTIVNDYIWWN